MGLSSKTSVPTDKVEFQSDKYDMMSQTFEARFMMTTGQKTIIGASKANEIFL